MANTTALTGLDHPSRSLIIHGIKHWMSAPLKTNKIFLLEPSTTSVLNLDLHAKRSVKLKKIWSQSLLNKIWKPSLKNIRFPLCLRTVIDLSYLKRLWMCSRTLGSTIQLIAQVWTETITEVEAMKEGRASIRWTNLVTSRPSTIIGLSLPPSFRE